MVGFVREMLVMIGVLGALLLIIRGIVRSIARASAVSREVARKKAAVTVGFFHPYCNAGGGGERVLWCALNAIHKKYPNAHCVVYTGDVDATKEQILATAKDRFGTVINSERITFAFLHRREWVEAKYYPHFTMLMQSLGSIVLGWEAMTIFIPDIYIDTMGYAFTFPLFSWIAGSKVGCYVHYPTISTDMLQKVKNRSADFNNKSYVSESATLSSFKLLYYRIFARMYGWVGSLSQVTMVNSTWTANHINIIWRGLRRKAEIVYPPCDTESLSKLPLSPRRNEIVSVAQFRPEKNHLLQIQSFKRFLSEHSEYKGKITLCLIGGCRNQGDQERVDSLKKAVSEMGLKEGNDVKFLLNIPLSELQTHLASAVIGLHTMRDEHFGIGVVEFLASGTIAIGHNSAGPRSDIIVPFNGKRTGFLAETEQEYADIIAQVLRMSEEQRIEIQTAARSSVSRFSEESFESSFIKHIAPLFD